ncbi:hypothetical protein INT48_006860 [Thamnidium elegans]|uniref:Major facilitator superfamily (MFS) profile domain-containing protein n=1 Tax=Thamnidium elegans TaxID=101142 RepID=A0A8H7SQU5_9FUNG|nr:hypothetical protein INT48_006860 [Thamnidium elegans]
MTLPIHEQEPLLTDSSQNRSNYVVTKDLDEESLGDNKIVDEHDAEYIINNRLGNVSLFMVTFCLSMSGFLAAVDTSIVTTIFNEIGTEFKSSNLSVWIMTSYMLSTSALQPLYGKLSDIFGRKSTLVAILCFFLIGSGLCGMANSMVQMSIARAIAGLGGGGLMTMASVVIHDLIPMRSRGKYQSYVNMAQTVGTTIGAPLGGFINDYFENYNLVRGARTRDNLSKKLEQIDFVGAILLLIANLSFVTGASLGGNTHDWNDPVIVTLLSTAVSFFFFFGLYEFNWAKHPLVSRSLIKNRNVVAVCYNASSAGLWVLPRTAMVGFGCWLAGKYLGMTGRYKNFLVSILVLQLLAAVGTLSWKIDTSIAFRLLCMNMEGFCFGVVLVATMVALVADITHFETASATSMIFLCRSTGWLSGSTVTAAILQSSFKNNLSKKITGPEAADIIEFVRTSITKLRTLAPEIQVVVITSLEQAMHPALGYGVACSALCFIVTLFMRDCQLGAK